MNTKKSGQKEPNKVLIWAVALIVTFVAFYGLNHFVMSIQGLPLKYDLTPAQ